MVHVAEMSINFMSQRLYCIYVLGNGIKQFFVFKNRDTQFISGHALPIRSVNCSINDLHQIMLLYKDDIYITSRTNRERKTNDFIYQ